MSLGANDEAWNPAARTFEIFPKRPQGPTLLVNEESDFVSRPGNFNNTCKMSPKVRGTAA